jgi:hypothetical protein
MKRSDKPVSDHVFGKCNVRDLPSDRLYSTGAEETAADDRIGLSALNGTDMISHLIVADIKTARG